MKLIQIYIHLNYHIPLVHTYKFTLVTESPNNEIDSDLYLPELPHTSCAHLQVYSDLPNLICLRCEFHSDLNKSNTHYKQ